MFHLLFSELLHIYHLFLNDPPHTHLELLNSPLQALCGEVGLFGRQLILCCLKPPEERARVATELEQLLLTGLHGGKPGGQKDEDTVGRMEAVAVRMRRSCMEEQ